MSSRDGTDLFEYDLYHASRSGNFFERFYHGRRCREVENLIGDHPGRVLEYGCNTGAVLIHLAERGLDVAGYDISENNVQAARGNLASLNLQAEVHCRELPPDEQWDVVLLINVLEYACDKDGLLEHVAAHLAPGGRIVAAVANPWHPVIRFDGVRVLLSRRDKKDIALAEPPSKLDGVQAKALFLAHGFRVERRTFGLGWVNTYFVLGHDADLCPAAGAA